MADDLINQLATACVCGPLDADGACLSCCARTEIERLRAAGDALAKSLAEFHDPFDELRLLAWQEARRG